MSHPLLTLFPALKSRVQPVSLGDFPTAVARLEGIQAETSHSALYIKRDDASASAYGGNKVRTLEVLFGLALAAGAREVVATGAYGSNHAAATVLHAGRAGLLASAILFPQPGSWAALENLRVTVARAHAFSALRHWSFLPLSMLLHRRTDRFIMAPGGATPEGALGYVAAGLELAQQVARGELLTPHRIVLGVGSTCTTAGLLVGLVHARRLGLLPEPAPSLVAVRVTPWPITSRVRILNLARRTARLLSDLADDPRLGIERAELGSLLEIDAGELGAGYGRPTAAGREAMALFARRGLPALDTTYSAKAAACFLRHARAGDSGPLLFWCTKSSAPLPAISGLDLARARPRVRRWMARVERDLAARGELPRGLELVSEAGS